MVVLSIGIVGIVVFDAVVQHLSPGAPVVDMASYRLAGAIVSVFGGLAVKEWIGSGLSQSRLGP